MQGNGYIHINLHINIEILLQFIIGVLGMLSGNKNTSILNFSAKPNNLCFKLKSLRWFIIYK